MIVGWQHALSNGTRGDVIDLGSIDANPTTWADNSFSWIASKTFGGHSGELRYENRDGHT